jgi:Protein of unknown function (DUF2793)
MANTTNLGLPLMAAAQSQKHITHNDALLSLDALVQLSVKSTTLTAPPGSPAEGDRYLIGSGATAAWVGKDLNITYYTSGAWIFLVPRKGWLCWDEVNGVMLVWTGSAWQNQLTAGGVVTTTTINNNSLPGRLTILGLGGATADSTNRLSINSPAALFNNAGTSIALTLNKNALANDASFTFQTAFSSRALFGLLGDDHFTIKTTPNGSTYKTGLIVSKDTAAVQLVEHPKFSCYCNFGNTYAAGWLDMLANIARHNDQGDLVIASNVATFTAPHDGYYMFGAGATLETGGTPTAWQLGISVNNATPASDTISNSGGDATFTTLESGMSTTALLKLTAGQTVKAKLNITGGGRVVADRNYFWGCQIA